MQMQALKALIRRVTPEPMLMRYQARRARQNASEPELAFYPLLAPYGDFVDIGAHFGAWSYRAAAHFTHVHAFEANERLASFLQATMPSNVTVWTIALSDHQGTGQFSVPLMQGHEITTRGSLEEDANAGYTGTVRQVRMTTLDSLSLPGIGMIKIDVEGHEGAVLEGASQTIARDRPVIVAEIEDRHHPGRSAAIFERIAAQHYACRFIRHNRLQMFDPGMLGELQPAHLIPEFGHAKSGSYINNFVLIPAEKLDLERGMNECLAQAAAVATHAAGSRSAM